MLEAFQMTEERIKSQAEWPQWMRDALASSNLSPFGQQFRVRAILVRPDSWVCRELSGRLVVFSKKPDPGFIPLAGSKDLADGWTLDHQFLQELCDKANGPSIEEVEDIVVTLMGIEKR